MFFLRLPCVFVCVHAWEMPHTYSPCLSLQRMTALCTHPQNKVSILAHSWQQQTNTILKCLPSCFHWDIPSYFYNHYNTDTYKKTNQYCCSCGDLTFVFLIGESSYCVNAHGCWLHNFLYRNIKINLGKFIVFHW